MRKTSPSPAPAPPGSPLLLVSRWRLLLACYLVGRLMCELAESAASAGYRAGLAARPQSDIPDWEMGHYVAGRLHDLTPHRHSRELLEWPHTHGRETDDARAYTAQEQAEAESGGGML